MRKTITIMKKVVPLWAIALIIISIFAATATAAYVYQLSISGTVTVTEAPQGNYGVEAYSDLACTQPLTNIDFGTMTCGEQKQITIWLKNTGDQTITSVYVVTLAFGTSVSGQHQINLTPGSTIQQTITLAVSHEVTAGTYPTTTTLNFIA